MSTACADGAGIPFRARLASFSLDFAFRLLSSALAICSVLPCSSSCTYRAMASRLKAVSVCSRPATLLLFRSRICSISPSRSCRHVSDCSSASSLASISSIELTLCACAVSIATRDVISRTLDRRHNVDPRTEDLPPGCLIAEVAILLVRRLSARVPRVASRRRPGGRWRRVARALPRQGFARDGLFALKDLSSKIWHGDAGASGHDADQEIYAITAHNIVGDMSV